MTKHRHVTRQRGRWVASRADGRGQDEFAESRQEQARSCIVDPAVTRRSALAQVIQSTGEPLASDIQLSMEAYFGADFSDVRVHVGDDAHRSAVSLNALAYTCGHHIVFRHGGYEPGSLAGRRLLAHELTHVVQQRRGLVPGKHIGEGIWLSDCSDPYEQEANAAAHRLENQPRPMVATGPENQAFRRHDGIVVQRFERMPRQKPTYRRSQTRLYILDGTKTELWAGEVCCAPTVLWVRVGTPDEQLPHYCVPERADTSRDFDGVKYRAYRPSDLFLPDCLHTAEEIINERRLGYGIQVASLVRGDTKEFGRNLRVDNEKVVKEYAAKRVRPAIRGMPRGDNETERPDRGEAFLAFNMAYVEGVDQFPFHAAAVVAVDGNDLVTIEQTARVIGDTHAGEGRNGAFDIYEVKDIPGGKSNPKTFHARCIDLMGKDLTTITIVRMPNERQVNLIGDPVLRVIPPTDSDEVE